jgi:hypothetical protein
MTVKAQTLLERLPGFVFTAASPVHVSSDLGFLAFNMGVRRVADSQWCRRSTGAWWKDRGVARTRDS